MNLKKEFDNPSKDWRGTSYWAWNDELREEELIRQVREMKDKGMGGFFPHGRPGRITPYLSKKWMDCIKACISEAKKIGMDAWLYDEDGWPSGFAGGKVVAENEDYRMRVLEIAKRTNKEKGGESDTKYSYSFIKCPRADNWLIDGFCYIDTLNPEAVKAFIESTYQAYYAEVGDEFGKTVPGIFTDEPIYLFHPSHSGQSYILPWTDALPAYFKAKNGYDVREHLVSLVDNTGPYHKVRYDYWRTVTELFVTAYSKQIYDWCESHKLKFTGHYMHEDTLNLQIQRIGAAMPHYEYMHIPGVDHLCKRINYPLLTIKQVSSVAHQLGRERVFSELYGASGWNLGFEDQKWIGDWDYALGINLRCQHLGLYSLRGSRKREYPPSVFCQQPWWKYHRKLEDYFARLSLVLSQGGFAADILVLHPVESAWSVYSPENSAEVDTLNESFFNLSRFLCELHRDYDYGDESLMEKYARVEGNKLIVGESEYKAVIIPPTVSIRKHTLDLLKTFFQAGGAIIAVKPLPFMVQGEKSAELRSFLKNPGIRIISRGKAVLDKNLSQILPGPVAISDKKGKNISRIYCHRRRLGNKEIYFLANISRAKSYAACIRVEGSGSLEEWDLDTGRIKALSNTFESGYTSFELSFAPVQSHLVVLTHKKPSEVSGNKQIKREETRKNLPAVKTISLGDSWDSERLDPNALTLDYCRYQIGNRPWSEKMPVWKVHLKNFHGFKDSSGGRIKTDARETRIKLQYDFNLQAGRDKIKELCLVLETPEKFNIKVNGETINNRDFKDWWIDTSFRRADILPALKQGKNIIELSYEYKPRYDSKPVIELESCYVTGDFRVDVRDNKNFVLLADSAGLRTGDWVEQGYPFFAGTIAYTQKLRLRKNDKERIFIEFDGVSGAVVKVAVNRREAGLLAWAPYRLEITQALRDGENEIRIELTNSLHNLLGPHHHKDGELISAGPGSWSDEANWVDEYNFVKCGLSGKVRLRKYISVS